MTQEQYDRYTELSKKYSEYVEFVRSMTKQIRNKKEQDERIRNDATSIGREFLRYFASLIFRNRDDGTAVVHAATHYHLNRGAEIEIDEEFLNYIIAYVQKRADDIKAEMEQL